MADNKLPRRVQFLHEGAKLASGDRDVEYGSPHDNLSNCAILFTAYLHAKYGGVVIDPLSFTLTAEDVAWLNVQQKIARTFGGRVKPDTYVDAATYSAIAGECAEEGRME